jgi:HlyD family secretion protein
MASQVKRILIAAVLIVVLALVGFYGWKQLRSSGPGEAFISGNGRIEATEIDVAAKLGGRVQNILVNEGDFVLAGQSLAQMQIESLEAHRDEVRAQYQQAIQAVSSADAQVAARESDKAAAQAALAQRESDLVTAQAVVSERESSATATQAVVVQRESELDATRRRLARSETLSQEGASSIQELDDDRAKAGTAQAALSAAKAQVASAQSAIRAAQAQAQMAQAAISAAKAQVVTAEATIKAARSQVVGAQLGVEAGKAMVSRVEVDIKDGTLTSPRDGRVQYRIAQPGEVLGNGGKVLNLVDLGDVYMTFFLPETAAGRVALGSDVHVVLDAAPQYVIPAKVSFVASTAQFTPKTVETASERQKLMFRVKAQIDRELLRQHMKMVKTGLPGVAWIKLDPKAKWPTELEVKVVE